MIQSRQTTGPAAAAVVPAGGILRLALWCLALAAVVAAGLLLWRTTGPAIFTDMVSAAIAWCF